MPVGGHGPEMPAIEQGESCTECQETWVCSPAANRGQVTSSLQMPVSPAVKWGGGGFCPSALPSLTA